MSLSMGGGGKKPAGATPPCHWWHKTTCNIETAELLSSNSDVIPVTYPDTVVVVLEPIIPAVGKLYRARKPLSVHYVYITYNCSWRAGEGV